MLIFLLCCVLSNPWIHSSVDAQENKHKWYIDSNHGIDAKKCGNYETPCKSLEYSWHLLDELVNNKHWLPGTVEFLLGPGFYTSYEVLPLFFSCVETNIPSISVTGYNSTNISSVILTHSFFMEQCAITFKTITFVKAARLDFHGCEVSISDTAFVNITMAMNFYECSLVSFVNMTIFNATSPAYKQLIQLDSCVYFNMLNSLIIQSNISRQILFVLNTAFIAIQNVEINNNIGCSPWEGIVFSGAENMDVIDLTVTKNMGIPLLVYSVKNAMFHSMTFSDNYMHRNKSSVQQYFIGIGDSTLTLQDSTFSCNSYSDSNYGSPIYYNEKSHFECNSCSSGSCPVNCSAGQEVTDDVLCIKCEPGTAKNGTEIKCRKCNEGTYAASHGESVCIKCSSGKYCPKKGCTHCIDCDSDFFTSDKGAKHCAKVTLLLYILIAIFSLLLLFGIMIVIMKRCFPSEEKYDNLYADNDDESDDVFTGENQTGSINGSQESIHVT